MLCRAGAGSPLPRPSRLKKLGSVFTGTRCFPSAPAQDPGPYCLWGSFPWFCFEKVVPGDKNPFSCQITSSSTGRLGPSGSRGSGFLNALLVVFPHLLWPWLGLYPYAPQYETPSCRGRRFGRQINVPKGHPDHSPVTPPRPLLVVSANSP